MHLAGRVLVAAIIPSLAAAQSDSRSAAVVSPPTAVVAQQARVAGSSADTTDLVTAARLAALDCSTMATTLAAAARAAAATTQPADSASARTLRTASLVAALCAQAQRQGAAETARVQAATPGASASRGGDAHGDAHGDEHGQAGEHPEADGSARDAAATPKMRLHAFADVRYSAIDSLGSRNGFALGQFDLFARSQLSDDFSVLSELVLTALPRNQFTTRLERLLLTYSPSDYVAASLGRFHTGIGYYNSAYHHGAWFQTATGRPLIFSPDGDIGVVPIHTLGLSMTGEIPSGALGLRYIAELGSGRAGQSSAAVAPQPGLVDNNTPSVNLGLLARPDAVDGLQLGVSVYRDRLTLQDSAHSSLGETVSAAHVVYKTDLVEILGEAVMIRQRPRSADPATSVRGYYAQASRRFGLLRPYARYDHVDAPPANRLFGFLGRRSGPTAGIRYDFDALAALKVQASHLHQTTRSTLNRVDAQVAFMF